MFLRLLFLTLFLSVVIFVFINGNLLDSFGNSPQFSVALAGSFAIYMASRPSKREIFVTIFVGILFRIAFEATIGVNSYFGSELISLAGFIGAASIMVLAIKTIQHKDDPAIFVTAAFFPFVSILVGILLPITNGLMPVTFDAYLLAVDSTLGFQPSFILGRIIREHPHWLLWEFTTTIYYALPFPVALLCAMHLTTNIAEVRRLLCLFGVTSFIGFCIFIICPATGPTYAFHEWFPLKPPQLSEIKFAVLSVPTFPRNAIPSLHLSTALLVFWNTSTMGKAIRIAAGLFLGLTAFATLALGEHYLTDLIVAVPFSMIFQAAFTNSSSENATWRYYAMLGSVGFVAVWLFTLRFYGQTLVAWPTVTCFFFIATLGFSFLARRQLNLQVLKLSTVSTL